MISNKLRVFIVPLLAGLATTAVIALAMTGAASALDPGAAAQGGVSAAGGGAGGQGALRGSIRDVINVLLFIIGAVAVIMIVVGGLRYVLSGGDSGQVKSAKDTVLYSVIGLVIALLAYAIVNFVIAQF